MSKTSKSTRKLEQPSAHAEGASIVGPEAVTAQPPVAPTPSPIDGDAVAHDAAPSDVHSHDAAPSDIVVANEAAPSDVLAHDAAPPDIVAHDTATSEVHVHEASLSAAPNDDAVTGPADSLARRGHPLALIGAVLLLTAFGGLNVYALWLWPQARWQLISIDLAVALFAMGGAWMADRRSRPVAIMTAAGMATSSGAMTPTSQAVADIDATPLDELPADAAASSSTSSTESSATDSSDRQPTDLDPLRDVFDHAFDAILTLDAGGRIRSANRAARTLFRRTAEQMSGEPVHRFLRCTVPGATAPANVPAGVTASDALRSDGIIVPVEYSMACSGDGPDRVFTVIARDTSERSHAENRIRSFAEGLEVTNRRLEEANAQLEEASRLKSEFLANTSHELRTPLNGMIGFLQLVLDGMCDSREEEREFLQQALQCSRRLLGLINDVLDIAKIEAGKLSLEIEAIDVRAMFGEIYTLTHVQSAQKGLSLKFEAPEKPVHMVRGDFNKLKQVLINLVGNSLKFTNSGSITVRATEHAELGHYLFEVVDTGIGIPEDRRKIVFEKFTQVDGSSTRKYGGTGLGLAITKSLVELMGGIIDVQSAGPGKGTCIYFSLPLWRTEDGDSDVEGERVSDRIEGPSGGPVILVVEDDGVFRKYVTSLLHHHGYRTIEASHAEGGWLLARRMRPGLVVLDYALASADSASLRTGWDLAERMTTDPATRHIPLIFVTGFDVQIKERLQAALFTQKPEHLMKPVDGHVLVQRIEEMVGASRDSVVRVLMADDDPSVAAYVRKVLPEERYYIEVVNNGDECLHALRTQPRGFDLLLLDLMMPDVSGYDVLRELSLSETCKELPVLILTNFPDARTDEEKRLLEKGLVVDVLSKSSVHDNPVLLSHTIDWHLQVANELGRGSQAGLESKVSGSEQITPTAHDAPDDELREAA